MTPNSTANSQRRCDRGGARANPRTLKRLATAGAVAALALLSGNFALACSAEPDPSSSTAATTAATDAVQNAVTYLTPIVSTQNVSGGTLTTIQPSPRQASSGGGGGSTTIYRSSDNGSGGGGATIISSNSGNGGGGGGGVFTSTGSGASGIVGSGIGSFASTGAGNFNPFDAVFANGFGKK